MWSFIVLAIALQVNKANYREEIVPFDPSTVAPAVAVVNGIPQLLNTVGSFVASALIVTSGYGHTLMIFQVLCIVSIVASLILTECGPRAKKAENAEA